jgi:hypothetical protein
MADWGGDRGPISKMHMHYAINYYFHIQKDEYINKIWYIWTEEGPERVTVNLPFGMCKANLATLIWNLNLDTPYIGK